MHAQRFDLITRHAAHGISRRGSVLALGGVSLAALADGPNVAARNKHKKRNKRNKRKCRKRARRRASDTCQREAEDCEVSFAPAGSAFQACCAPLATCDYAEFFGCLSEQFEQFELP